MRSVNFELQISEKKCALYTGNYGTKTIKQPAFDFQMSFIKELIQRTVAKFLISICLSAANDKVLYEVIALSSHYWTRLRMQAVFWYSLSDLIFLWH